jgi:hypothetical protein
VTRFEILKLLSANTTIFGYPAPISCAELAKRAGHPRFYSRSYKASLTTRLRRLWNYGLVIRQFAKSRRPGPRRVSVWTISPKGMERLSWAKAHGRV